MLTARRLVVARLVALVWGSAPAFASFDTRIVVAVPMENGDEGSIELRYVTYLLSLGSAWPGVELQYTCSPAPVLVNRANRADMDTLDVEDDNIAHGLGLTIQIENRQDPRTWNSPHSSPPGARWGERQEWPRDGYVDTLVVQLHTQAAYEHDQANARSDHVLDAVVRATIDCIRDNASRSQVPIHHVKLVVTGPQKYRKLGGMMRITPRPNRGALHSY